MTESSGATVRTVAILGGTGNLGRGMAVRLAKAGHRVVIGSRDADRAAASATEVAQLTGSEAVTGADVHAAQRQGRPAQVGRGAGAVGRHQIGRASCRERV